MIPRITSCTLLLLACGCQPPFERTFDVDNAHVSLALLPEDRYRLVQAVDILMFSGDAFDCATLLNSRLDDLALRAQATSTTAAGVTNPEHVRLCQGPAVSLDGGAEARSTLGRVAAGKKVVLVTASHLTGPCTSGTLGAVQAPEVVDPGLVLAAGCETTTVVGGKLQKVRVPLFPFRDPGP